jgi:hypothetical protein
MKKYNVIDLFAGCGGLSEGFLQSGRYNFLAHIEWEMPMVETLRNNLVKRWNYNEEDAEVVSTHTTNYNFAGKGFYSVACSCAVNLYPHLKGLGLLYFVGFNDTFIVRGEREPFIVSALSGLQSFLSGSNVKASKEKMQATFDEQIAILNETDPWAAVDLVHNKEALVFEGEDALDFSSLTNEESVPNNQLKTS